jgi:L-rhamnose mutarotase
VTNQLVLSLSIIKHQVRSCISCDTNFDFYSKFLKEKGFLYFVVLWYIVNDFDMSRLRHSERTTQWSECCIDR